MVLPVVAPTSIPQQTFIRAGDGKWSQGRINLVGVDRILDQTQTYLGVSGYQMARLLGKPWPSIAMNAWRNGRSSIGTLYMGRLLQLWWLKMQGMEVCYMQKIDWETGTIYWRRNGHKNHLPDGGGIVERSKGSNRD